MGSEFITMADSVYVGIAATSRNTATATRVVADSFRVTASTTGNQPPSVSLTAPANNAAYTAPANVALSATASDPNGTVTRVDFFRNSVLIGSDTSSGYTATWSAAPAGSYALTAVAYDNTGASTTSNTVTIQVNGASNAPPMVSLTAPANGATATAPASITLTATASDPENRLSRVEFFAGTTLLVSDTAAPFSFAWTSVAAGSYALRAVAYDLDGGSATSAIANITVNPGTTIGPPRAIVFQQSVDHASVTSYRMDIFANGANPTTATPVATSNLAKPTPATNGDITVDRAALFSALAVGTYQATVTAINSNGSSRSAAVTFTR